MCPFVTSAGSGEHTALPVGMQRSLISNHIFDQKLPIIVDLICNVKSMHESNLSPQHLSEEGGCLGSVKRAEKPAAGVTSIFTQNGKRGVVGVRTDTGTSSIVTLAVGSERNCHTGVGGLEPFVSCLHSLGVLGEVTRGFLAWL